jgi:two-component system response regulator VicR
MSAKILIVDDDRFLAENIKRLLNTHGYTADIAGNADEALQNLIEQPYDLMILDLGLPDNDGINFCRQLRAKWLLPIIMLTARSDAMDKVIGLEVGADDYLTKPFEPKELLARIRAHLRRAQEYRQSVNPPESVVVGDLVIDYKVRDVLVKGEPANLTNREFELISFFARHSNKALHRDWVFEQIWGYDSDFSSNSLDVYVYRLRKKIEADPDNPRHLMTLRGYGYKFVTE